MLVAGIVIGIVWWYIGMMGHIYWSNEFVSDRIDEWWDSDVYRLIYTSLLGPLVWIIGYLVYRQNRKS